jgi:hypothetical protein
MTRTDPPEDPVPRPRLPSPSSSGRTTGCSVDGRRWELLTSPTGVTAVTSAGTVAEAHVSERDGRVVVEFGALEPGLPPELSADLVAHAFALPAVGPPRPVLVCVPRRGGELLVHARRYVQGAQTRAAGVTCIVEGRIGEHSPAVPTAVSPRSRPRIS